MHTLYAQERGNFVWHYRVYLNGARTTNKMLTVVQSDPRSYTWATLFPTFDELQWRPLLAYGADGQQ